MKKTIISLIIIFAVLGVFALSCYASALDPSAYTYFEYYENDTKYYRVSFNSMDSAYWRSYYNGTQTKLTNAATFAFPSGFTDMFYVGPSNDRQSKSIFEGFPSSKVVMVFRFDLPLFANLGRPGFDSIYCNCVYYNTANTSAVLGSFTVPGVISPYVPGESSFTVTFEIDSSLITGNYFHSLCTFDFAQSVEWNGVTCTLEGFYYQYSESVWDILFEKEPSGVDQYISSYENEMSGIVAEMSEVDAQQSAILEDIPLPNETSALSDFSAFDTSDFNDFWGNPKLSQFMLWFGVIGVASFTLVLYRKLLLG